MVNNGNSNGVHDIPTLGAGHIHIKDMSKAPGGSACKVLEVVSKRNLINQLQCIQDTELTGTSTTETSSINTPRCAEWLSPWAAETARYAR